MVLKGRCSSKELRSEYLGYENYLVRDLLGYRIRPHKDKLTKLVTTVFYVESGKKEGTGTSLFFNDSKSLHYQLDFAPNTLFAFAPYQTSFNGIETQVSNSP